MRLDISNIKGNLNSQVAVNFDVVLNEEDSEINFTDPVHVSAVISNTDSGYDIDGLMDVSLDATCYRCLNSFHYHKIIELHDNLNNYEEESGEKIFYNSGSQVFLDNLVRTNLLLSLPMRYLCSDDCQGINYVSSDLDILNDMSEKEPIDPRLEVLKKFLKQ